MANISKIQIENTVYDVKDTTAREELTHKYDTVSDMKLDTNLTNGLYAKTMGYNQLNDGGGAYYIIRNKTNADTIDEMFILSLSNNTLVAELIVENINILQLGAKNDQTTDISTILNNAIAKLNYILIPNGNYLITNNITLKSQLKIEGHGEVNLLVENTAQIILNSNASSNYSLYLNNLTFRFNGNRNNYGLDLKDLVYSTIENCIFRSDDGTTTYNGVRLIKDSGENYDNTISNCFFQKSALTLYNSTDNFIINNKIWANGVTGDAITLIDNCGNTLIKGNHIIGGTHGGIVSNGTEKVLLRIVNNYFDGQQRALCGTTYQNCVISDNVFYNMGWNPIETQQMFNCTFSNNTFYQKDVQINYHDINVTYNHGSNVFSNNTHYRNNIGSSGYQAPYAFVENNPIGDTIVTNANCSFSSNFPTQDSFTHVKFSNCYPTALFPNV